MLPVEHACPANRRSRTRQKKGARAGLIGRALTPCCLAWRSSPDLPTRVLVPDRHLAEPDVLSLERPLIEVLAQRDPVETRRRGRSGLASLIDPVDPILVH